MDTVSTVIGVALLVVGWWVYPLFFVSKVDLKFWHRVSMYGDEAFDWFVEEECWFVPRVENTRRIPAGYSVTHTFLVPKLGNEKVKVYGPEGPEVADSKRRFLERYRLNP